MCTRYLFTIRGLTSVLETFSELPALLLLEISLPVLPNCAAYMHHIHLPRDFREDQGANAGPTSPCVGIDIRIRPGVSRLASRRDPAGEQVPPGAETYKS
jgi:hypothetical protein